MKIKNKFWNSGISIVEVLVGVGIIGAGAWVFMKSSGQFQKVKTTLQTGNNIESYVAQTLSASRLVLFKTKNSTTKLKDQGICKLIKKEPDAQPPVGAISINLSKFNTLFTNAQWNKFFPDWSLTNNNECKSSSKFKFCFNLKTNSEVPTSIKKLKPILLVEITPQNMDPYFGKIFENLSPTDLSNSIDVKRVGFNFKTSIYFNNSNNNRSVKSLSSFDWLGTIGYCDYTDKKTKVKYKISMTGMESVVSDPGREVIFNTNGFGKNDSLPDPIKTYFKSGVAQKGTYDAQGAFIYTSEFTQTSCKEIKYRCPNLNNDDKREYSDLSINASLNFIQQNNRTQGSSSIRTKITYDILKNQSKINANIDKYYGLRYAQGGSTIDADCSDPNGSPLIVSQSSKCLKGNSVTKNLTGTMDQSVTIFDKGSKTSSNKVCRKICNAGNSYNTNGDPNNNTQRYTGQLKFEFLDLPTNRFQIEPMTDSIGCTACNMKNCQKFGLGTFGKMSQMPDQPLDSNIPECVVNESKYLINDDLTFRESRNLSSTGSELCIRGKWNSVTNKIKYSNWPCSSNYPVMCYSYGSFMLAKDISGSSSSLSTKTNSLASLRCFQTSHESINQTKLTEALQIVPSGLSTLGSNYDYYNLANQGSFLAPQTSKDLNLFKNWCESNKSYCDNYFWTGLMKDGNNIISQVPVINDNINKENDAIYYENNIKRLFYYKIIFDFKPEKITSKEVGLLFYNIKFKGVKWVNSKKPYKDKNSKKTLKFKFLCKKRAYPYNFVISSGKSENISDGKSICSGESAYFLPPMNPAQWTQTMLLVNSNDQNLPFPNPSTLDIKNAVWVAVEKTSSLNSEVNWKIYKESDFLPNYLDESSYKPGKYGEDIIVIDKEGKYHDPFVSVTSNASFPITIDPAASGPEKFKFKIDGNSHEVSYDPGKIISIGEFVTDVNTEVGKDVIHSKDGKLFLRSRKVGKRGKLKIKSNIFGFPSGTVNYANKGMKEVCLGANHKLNFDKNYPDSSCTNKLTKEDIDSSRVVRMLWKLNQSNISSSNYYYFKTGN